ncbi:MAG: hypothetical protein RBU45_16865 [Myxococcota bacterium]|jgi:hypothetical protein|nr:hypothetical protein [Myxococcota bacterium]
MRLTFVVHGAPREPAVKPWSGSYLVLREDPGLAGPRADDRGRGRLRGRRP